MADTSVTVVVPCRNERDYIRRCIDALIRQDYPAHLLEIVVSDGMSDDGTREILAELSTGHSNVHVIDNIQKVTPVALNLGIMFSDAPVKIILGAHSEVYPDFVSQNVATLEAHPDCGCVGGWWENVYANDESITIGLAMSSPFGVGNAHYRTSLTEGYVDTAGFGAYRKEVFDQIGYFDEELVRNQDDEFNFRLLKAGYRIWLSRSIRCRYYVRASFAKLAKQQFQYGYWKVFVNKKHSAITTWRQLVPAFFVSYLVVASILLIISGFRFLWPLYPLVLYIVLAIVEAVRLIVSKKKNLKHLPGIIFAFFALHTSYGRGYLQGIWHFIFLNKKPAEKKGVLTR